MASYFKQRQFKYMTLERLEQIEAERLDTMLSDNFIQWMKDLNISRLYTSPESKINAREMNSQYDFSKKKNKVAALLNSSYL